MTPTLSEFSYGFALTNELVGMLSVHSCPIFPSLIEEGRSGGGYDVKLDVPGIPLFIQFKRSDYMVMSSANEIKNYGLNLAVPFHRFEITSRCKSDQHRMLVELDDGSNLVYYAAPRFHTFRQINRAWQSGKVAARSVFFRPSDIGLLPDDAKHTVAFDNLNSYFCSEPKYIDSSSLDDVSNRLITELAEQTKPIEDKIQVWIDKLRAIEAESVVFDKSQVSLESFLEVEGIERLSDRDGAPNPELRAPRDLTPEQKLLREIADSAHRLLNAQFIVVQSKD